jgi:K+-sensing histidine kinase KdpD
MTQKTLYGERTKKGKVYMSDEARHRLYNLFDKECLKADQEENEELRLSLKRILGEILCC